MTRLQVKVRKLDDDILQNVRVQGAAGEKGRADLAEAKKAIMHLSEKIRGIQERAAASEVMVEELCKDIRTLDYAKKNLKSTITTLNQLHMLGTAFAAVRTNTLNCSFVLSSLRSLCLVMGVEQLRQLSHDRQYDAAAMLVKGVTDLMDDLSPYVDIPKVAELRDSVVAVRTLLKKQARSVA